MNRSTNKYSIWFRIIATTVVYLFAFNTLSFSLAPQLLLTQKPKVVATFIGGKIFKYVRGHPGVNVVAMGGIVGAGKTTAIPEVRGYLEGQGIDVVVINHDWFLKTRAEADAIVTPYLEAGIRYAKNGEEFYEYERFVEVLKEINKFKSRLKGDSKNLEISLDNLYIRGQPGKVGRRTIRIRKDTVVLVDGTNMLTEKTKEYFEQSFYFDISQEAQLRRVLNREKEKSAETQKSTVELKNRVNFKDWPRGEYNFAKNLRHYDYLIENSGNPRICNVRTVRKYGLEITYSDGRLASINEIVGTDKEEIKFALIAAIQQVDNVETLRTIMDVVRSSEGLFDVDEKRALIWSIFLADILSFQDFDMIAADYDGVLHEASDTSEVESKFIEVIRSLMQQKISHVIITGQLLKDVNQRISRTFRWDRLTLLEEDRDLFWLLLSTGGTARTVVGKKNFRPIEKFEDKDLGGKHDEIGDILRQIALEHSLEEAPSGKWEDGKFTMLKSPNGVTLAMRRLNKEQIAKVKDKIVVEMKKRMRTIEGLPESVEVCASVTAVDIVSTSKGRALARAIRLKNAKKIAVFADAVGTEENPGNDRSMLVLTEEQIKGWEPTIDWKIELVKVYVGNEPVENIPKGCIIAPASGPGSTFEVYEAIAKIRQKRGGTDLKIDLESLDREFSSQTHPDTVRESDDKKVDMSIIQSISRVSESKVEIRKPVDIYMDLSLISKQDMEDNLKEWALIIKMHRDIPVNFIFKSSEKALVSEVETKLKELLNDTPELKKRINTAPRKGAFKVLIKHVRNFTELNEDEYPVAMAGENISNGQVALRDFNAAVKIGLIQTVFARNIPRQGDEDHGQKQAAVKKLRSELKPRLIRLYKACGVDIDLTVSDMDKLVSDNTADRLAFAIKWALPPICRFPLDQLKQFHKTMILVLQAA